MSLTLRTTLGCTEAIIADDGGLKRFYQVADILSNDFKVKFTSKDDDFDTIDWAFRFKGKLWGFGHFDIVPDILLLGKALGGGMPLGAFIADKQIMGSLTENPVLGHITTFGGHPVCCAAGMAAMKVLLEGDMIKEVKEKEELFKSLLIHPKIKSIRSFGLWMAVEFDSAETIKKIIDACIKRGVMTDWFLFAANCLRISPPLVISEEQIRKACDVILQACKAI